MKIGISAEIPAFAGMENFYFPIISRKCLYGRKKMSGLIADCGAVDFGDYGFKNMTFVVDVRPHR